MICCVCKKEIRGEYFKSNIASDLKLSDEGDVVCSMKCAEKYERELEYHGKPLQHWSRITGYYQNIAGWNKGKLQELKDRQRYGIPQENE